MSDRFLIENWQKRLLQAHSELVKVGREIERDGEQPEALELVNDATLYAVHAISMLRAQLEDLIPIYGSREKD